jgi:hypothetical protein
MHELESPSEPTAGDLVSFDRRIKTLNRTRAIGHRWRKLFPWLRVVNIFGKLYLPRESIAEFERRALAGEFQRDIRPNPNPMMALLPQAGRPRKRSVK